MKYLVHWHTSPTPGSTYYHGTEEFSNWDGTEAELETFCQKVVKVKSFPDYPLSHIVISRIDYVR